VRFEVGDEIVTVTSRVVYPVHASACLYEVVRQG
jgi:hypothetical protein